MTAADSRGNRQGLISGKQYWKEEDSYSRSQLQWETQPRGAGGICNEA